MPRFLVHLRRFWAPVGGLALGLTGSLIWAVLTKGEVPQASAVMMLVHERWPWFAAGFVVLLLGSITVEVFHRREEIRAPRVIRLDSRPISLTFPAVAAGTMVGRERELQRLKDWFAEVQSGIPRMVFVSGEPGIGKTTLVQAFLAAVAGSGVRIARGQCIEQYGAGEPYMPVLEALTSLCRGADGARLIGTLHRLAPAWLAQMSTMISAEDRSRLENESAATNRRMLRELPEALRVIAAEEPLILVLEDLHWSDPSTIDLLRAIGPRTDPMRLMVLGTYRPFDLIAADHPLNSLKQELQLHDYCKELSLPFLGISEVSAYLAQQPWAAEEFHRSPTQGHTGELLAQTATAIHARTEGNPLFVVTFVNYLRKRGSLRDAAAVEAPGSLRQMIERNFDQLETDHQRILEAACAAGAEFSAAAVAAALERPLKESEYLCSEIARERRFLEPAGEMRWPDGTVAAGFCFRHALYHEVLYARIPANHRLDLHRRIAARLECAYGAGAAAIAPALAHHFIHANDFAKAVEYAQLAGDEAVRRSADREAAGHFQTALRALADAAAIDSVTRDPQELMLQLKLVTPLMAVKGFSSLDVEKVFSRARVLSEKLGNPPQILPGLLWGLWVFYTARGRHREALAWAERCSNLAETNHDEGLALEASHALGVTWLNLAEFTRGLVHLERAINGYDPQRHGYLVFQYGQDTGVVCRSHAAWALWFQGQPDQATRMAEGAMAAARKLSQPYTLATVAVLCAWVSQLCGDLESTMDRAETAMALSNVEGFPFWAPMGMVMQGWVLAQRGQAQEGLGQMRRGLHEFRQVGGASVTLPYHLALLAQVLSQLNQHDEALASLIEAEQIAEAHEESWWNAEIARLRGELILRSQGMSHELALEDARRYFRRSLSLARSQKAKSLALRAATSLCRLEQSQGDSESARRDLSAIYGSFEEGFATRDLLDVKAILS